MKRKLKLTKQRVERAPHSGVGRFTIYRDTELPGFGLRVTEGGIRSFVVEYRDASRRKRRVTVGRFGPVTVDEARGLAKKALYAVAAGATDPMEERRRTAEGETLGDVAGRYLDDLRARAEAGAEKGRLSSWDAARKLWRLHVPSAIARRKVADVTLEDLRRLTKRLADADKAPTADHLRTLLHAVMEQARAEGLRPDNPVSTLKRYKKPARRRRALTLEELGRLGEALRTVEDSGKLDGRVVEPAAALALRLMALTGMRRSELIGHMAKARRGPREGLRWGDVDLEAGTYTLEAVGGGSGGKGGKPRTLPLGAGVVELLQAVRPKDADDALPVVPSPKDRTAPLVGLDRMRSRIYASAEIEGADAHSLRHSFETVAFQAAPAFAGALTGRALTRDAVLNSYLHLDDAALREVADKVAGTIAAALDGRLADVLAFREPGLA